MLMLILPLAMNAQIPQLVSYQAIIRGNDDSPLVNTPVTIVLTVRKTTPAGPDVYTETHNPTTNNFGLVNLKLGGGSTTGNFSLIDWSTGTYFLKVDVNGKEMGITQIVSTPYALYALKSANGLLGTPPSYYIENTKVGIGTSTPLSRLSVTGSAPGDSAIFEVKNNNGKTVFAVYNEGVRVYIDETLKASKGGFAIGGFSGGKSTLQEYFRVTRDSSRVYINKSAMTKGTKGGFAIGGFGTKAPIDNFVSLTKYNSLLGNSAGNNISTGTSNFFAGYVAGNINTTGSYNIFIGDSAGYHNNSNTNIFIGPSAGFNNITGSGSVIIGDKAGYKNNGIRNIFIGREAGFANTTGMDNVYLGSYSGNKLPEGSFNTFIGVESGNFSTDGWYNVYVGHRAGYVNKGSNNVVIGDLAGSDEENYLNPATSYTYSVFIGPSSGYKQQSGSGNTYIGATAGYSNIDGYGNVFIGNQAGQNELGFNKLYISNNNTTTPLIYGEFYYGEPLNQKVRINGKLEVATLPAGSDIAIHVNSTTGQLMKFSSSGRYKNEITDLDVNIKDYMSLRPVSFRWNSLTLTPGKEDLGLIAEEVNSVLPSLSVKNSDGSVEGVNYNAINILTLGVVQRQQIKIGELERSLSDSQSQILNLNENIRSNEIMIQKVMDELALLKKQVRKSHARSQASR